MTDRPQRRTMLRPTETTHETFVRHHRRHFGDEKTVQLGPDNPSLELFVRAVLHDEFRKLAYRYTLFPGAVMANNVSHRLELLAEDTLKWEPRWRIDVVWRDGGHEQIDATFDEITDAEKEKELIMNEGLAERVEVFYR